MASLSRANLFTHAPTPKNSLWCTINNYTYAETSWPKLSSALDLLSPTPQPERPNLTTQAQFRYPARTQLPIRKALSCSRNFIDYSDRAMTVLFLRFPLPHPTLSCVSLVQIFPHAGPHFWGGEMVSAVPSCSSFEWPPHLPNGC